LEDGAQFAKIPPTGSLRVGRERSVDARELAREVNARVLALSALWKVDSLVTFVCECGCMKAVTLRLDAYTEAGGAWLPGHEEAAVEREA
jgi:hypothetical protein